MKPPFKVTHDENANVVYITGSDNRPATSVEFPGGIVRFAMDDGEMVGVTIINPDMKFPETQS